MSPTPSFSVLIFGSCVSRDIFEIPEAAGLALAGYYARSSMGSLLAPAWRQPATLQAIASAFQRRMVQHDMDKRFLSALATWDADLLLLDLIDERFDLLVSPEGQRLTLSSEYRNATPAPLAGEIVAASSPAHFTYWKEGVTHVLEQLRTQGKLGRVRVLEVFWATQTASGAGLGAYSAERITKANKGLAKRYAYLRTLLPASAFITVPSELLLADDAHKWGISPFHYVPAFYVYAARALHDAAAQLAAAPAPSEQLAIHQVTLTATKNALTATIDFTAALPADQFECAFYLMKGKERIAARWYESSPHVTFPLAGHSGHLHAVGFVRHKAEQKVVNAVSNALTIDASHLAPLRARYGLILQGDYATQQAEGFRPRAQAAAIPMTQPMRWKHKDRNAEFALHAWRFMGAIWNALLATQDARYYHEALHWMEDWWVAAQRAGRSKYVWYDMAMGLRGMHLAFAIEVARVLEIASDHPHEGLIDTLTQAHLDWLSRPEKLTAGNHAIYQMTGLKMLGMAAGVPTHDAYCDTVLGKLLEDSFDAHYVCTENSPYYHHYNLALIGGIQADVFPNLAPRIATIMEEGARITPWLCAPNGAFYRVGDSEGKGVRLTATAADTMADMTSLSATGTTIVAKDLSASGYAIVRSHPLAKKSLETALFFHATSATPIHAHADQTGFVLFHQGVELFTDPGKYTYEYGAWREYFAGDVAHNVLGLADRTFLYTDTPVGAARMDPLRHDAAGYHLTAHVTRAEGFAVTRHLHFQPHQSLTIEDLPTHTGDAPLELRFQCGEQVTATLEEKRIRLSAAGMEDVWLSFDTPPSTITVLRGATEPRIAGWLSTHYHHKTPISTLHITFPPHTRRIVSRITLDSTLHPKTRHV